MPLRDVPRRLQQRVRARPVLFGGTVVAVVAVVTIVLVVFQPQRLLFDTVVDEEFPTAGATQDAPGQDGDGPEQQDTGDEPDAQRTGEDTVASGEDADDDVAADVDEPEASPAGPVELGTGSFVSRSRYTVTGHATVYELQDGSRTLRLEDFRSTNGPNLFVYLTSADQDASDDALDADHVDLGSLRGNVGNQNYDIPADVDLEVYDTVVIWCRPFKVAFGAADLA